MDSFLGEIKLFPYNFAPQNWAVCNGALLQISSNTALFSLLGTMYGGDGQTTFGLPNLTAANPLASEGGVGYSICINGIYPSRE